MKHAIVLFARSPEREAAAKRMPAAAPLFRTVIAAWLHAASEQGATPIIACDARDRDALASIAPGVARGWIEQPDDTFGARVVSAASEAFTRGFDRVLIAAIDAPPPRALAAALETLATGTPVIGPANDGGINFIGITEVDRELLQNLTIDHCRERLPNALLFASTTDVDSQSSIDTARHEQVWRPYLHPQPATHTAHRGSTLNGITPVPQTRPPPPPA